MIEQHDKCSLHEIENLITSLKGIFEKKKQTKNKYKKNQTKKQTIQNKTTTKKTIKKRKKKILKLGSFDSIKR